MKTSMKQSSYKSSRCIENNDATIYSSLLLILVSVILFQEQPIAFAFVPTARTSLKNDYSSIKRNNRKIIGQKQNQSIKQQKRKYNSALGAQNDDKIPYIIERLGERPNDRTYSEIADMCISVFFNQGKPISNALPWKQVQLQYLRSIQTADLKRRRERDPKSKSNAMFVAYEVIATNDKEISQSKPLIIDFKNVYNLQTPVQNGINGNSRRNLYYPASETTSVYYNNNNNDIEQQEQDYVKGDLLGFCEVTRQPYGLPTHLTDKTNSAISSSTTSIGDTVGRPEYDQNGNYFTDEVFNSSNGPIKVKRSTNQVQERPILTNLSVATKGRTSGIGSKLLESCEEVVRKEWPKDSDIVLEVEDDNLLAQAFYTKRGYDIIYSDPASRRYDVNGLLLKKVRCTRQIFRKVILNNQFKMNNGNKDNNAGNSVAENVKQSINNLMNIFAR